MVDSNIISSLEELMRIRKAHQRSILQQSSLHVGQPAMLRFVREHPGCSQKQMADDARVTPASVAASFKRLENAGLISRRADTADTRCNRVYITEAGERELSYCQDALDMLDQTLTNGMTDQEIAALESAINKMITNLKNGSVK